MPVPFSVLPRHELTGNTMFGSESGSSFTTADPEHSSSHVCLNACTGLDQSQTSLQPYPCGREIRLYVLRPTGRADNRLGSPGYCGASDRFTGPRQPRQSEFYIHKRPFGSFRYVCHLDEFGRLIPNVLAHHKPRYGQSFSKQRRVCVYITCTI